MERGRAALIVASFGCWHLRGAQRPPSCPVPNSAWHLQLEGLQRQELHQFGPVESQQASFPGPLRDGMARGGFQPLLPHRWIAVPRHMLGRAALLPRVPVGMRAAVWGVTVEFLETPLDAVTVAEPPVRRVWAGREALVRPPVGAGHTEWGSASEGCSPFPQCIPPIVFWGVLTLTIPSEKQELAGGSVLRQNPAAQGCRQRCWAPLRAQVTLSLFRAL